ncbi:RCC1/BLIP-II [Lindgomyces ingoldianus]|uniref:RCC1/BLIP-II n=1 Tax=Lindgomyces ingoldianus TaxID=673940 RepID=A0ACB6QFT0_9PLEO|nr:RCC1/BLIP-II [Lindgomyces ingoldianus]KAF2465844.1 RCC1/BLIP-II [Lindgomyces ingoldianus]
MVAGATTFTALTTEGKVYTWTPDLRFPNCLGRRSHAGQPAKYPCPVPYLSHIKITHVRSGGYLTAAVSEDGELFLWGYANPTGNNNFAIFEERIHVRNLSLPSNPQDYEDDYVKEVPVTINGRKAIVTHVAVGDGHILIAAEANRGRERAVFAMGEGGWGQLGIGGRPTFVGSLQEVVALRGKKVKGLTCAGWSSWVVVDEEDED